MGPVQPGGYRPAPTLVSRRRLACHHRTSAWPALGHVERVRLGTAPSRAGRLSFMVKVPVGQSRRDRSPPVGTRSAHRSQEFQGVGNPLEGNQCGRPARIKQRVDRRTGRWLARERTRADAAVIRSLFNGTALSVPMVASASRSEVSLETVSAGSSWVARRARAIVASAW